MIGIDQVIVTLWLLPAAALIILPLFAICCKVLLSFFGLFRPVAGQERKPLGKMSASKANAAA